MKNRSPLAVFFLTLLTLGIYGIVWQVKTKGELNRLGGEVPTAWLLIVPFANIYWIWKYAEAVEKVTGGKISAVMTLLLMLLLGVVGMAILQSLYNKLGSTATVAAAPGPLPANVTGTPAPQALPTDQAPVPTSQPPTSTPPAPPTV